MKSNYIPYYTHKHSIYMYVQYNYYEYANNTTNATTNTKNKNSITMIGAVVHIC